MQIKQEEIIEIDLYDKVALLLHAHTFEYVEALVLKQQL